MRSEKSQSGAATFDSLFVGDMSVRYNRFNLIELFSGFGCVKEVDVNQGSPHDFKAFTGFGFVSFTSMEGAVKAQEGLHGIFKYGRRLRYKSYFPLQ
jgi:RNA recognition motif-containing protein